MQTLPQPAAPRQRKPRPRPARSLALLVRPTATSAGVLRLTVGKLVTDYVVLPVPSDFGRAFRLAKVAEPHDGYSVCIDGAGSLCDCKGHGSTRDGSPCKHVAALAKLIELGRL